MSFNYLFYNRYERLHTFICYFILPSTSRNIKLICLVFMHIRLFRTFYSVNIPKLHYLNKFELNKISRMFEINIILI